MIRCQNCGGEMEEGRDLCPHCGKAIAGNALSTEVRGTVVEAPGAAPMASFGQRREERDSSRFIIYGAVAFVALLLIGGLAYFASRPSAPPGQERLAGAIRPDSPDFPREKLVLDFDPDEDATIGGNALGNHVVTMKPTVRNFTGRVVNGLEFHAAGLDIHGKTIRERNFVAEEEIEPNRTASPAIGLNFPADNRPAQLRLELTGVRFK